jgi:multiple epidermal growth factor-like domains protein 10/11
LCLPNPCNTGTCQPKNDADAGYFKCSCPIGYIGTKCETYSGCNIVSLQCLNGGTCDPVTGNCGCAAGYEGKTCQTCNFSN